MKRHYMPDRLELIKRNSDFPGYREIKGSEERINYQRESNIRIWYNDIDRNCDEHWHDAIEMIMVEESWYDVISDGVTYHLETGDIILIPAGVMHSIVSAPTGMRFVFLINSEPYTKLKDYSVIRPLISKCTQITAKGSPKIYEPVKLLLHDACELYFSEDDFWETSIYTIVASILTKVAGEQLRKNRSACAAPLDKRSDYEDRFNEVLDYINTHYTEDLTLESTAAFCGFSKYYFATLFKEYFNTTFLNYLTEKRISVAAELLVSTDKPITDIAFLSGFSSISSFNRCFQNLKGCAPTKYKKLYAGK